MSYNPNIHHRHSIRLKGYDYAQGGLYFISICVQGRDCLLGNVANGVLVPNDAGRMVAGWYDELENKFPSIRCHAMVVMPNHFHCILEIVDGMGLDEYDNDDYTIKGAHVGAPPHEQPGNDDDISGMGANVDGTALDECDNDDCTIKGVHVGAPPHEQPRNDDDISGMGANVDQTALDECDNDDDMIKGAHVGAPPRGRPIGCDGRPETDDISGTDVDETFRGTHVGVPLPTVVGWFKTMTTNAYIRGVKNDGWKPFYGKLWQRNYYEHIIRNEKSYHNISEYIVNNPSKWDADKLNPLN
ncbi:transposase [Alistipes sp. ZOR0009]|uniref:transposase n=1 Tax=Alistipes sp. ZOR0009 TaxID=1339253 RepID=UPI0009DE28D0|nr:transposase [Alistipes sp. ZOR0009]